VKFYNVLRNRQPESRSLADAFRSRSNLIELIEYRVQLLGRNSDTGITHRETTKTRLIRKRHGYGD